VADDVQRIDDAPLGAGRDEDATDARARGVPGAHGDTIIGRAVTINRPVGELFSYWRDLTNLAIFMENVERIDLIDDKQSHWVVKAPGGKTVEWDAVITEEEPNRFMAWTSAPGADVANSGRVEFTDAGARGTVVSVVISYDPPGGTIGKIIAKMFQREPAVQARRDLRRFKQLMETGEIATGARNNRIKQEQAA